MTDDELKRLEAEAARLEAETAEAKKIAAEGKAEAERMRAEANRIITEANMLSNEAAAKAAEFAQARKRLEVEKARVEDVREAALQEQRLADLSRRFDKILADQKYADSLLEHQIVGAKRLHLAEKAILADRPGLGKTLTSLATADLNGAKKVIIVTPPDISSNFAREVQLWTNRVPISIVGDLKHQRDYILDVLAGLDEFVLLVAYSTWRIDLSIVDQLCALAPDMVIADEAHYVKSRKTKAFKGLERLTKGKMVCTNCGTEQVEIIRDHYSDRIVQPNCCIEPNVESSVKHLLLMTGTPLVNRPQDLFSFLTLIDPHNFYQERRFLERYCEQDYYTQKWKFRGTGLDGLIKQLSSRFVARTREDAGIVLPPQAVIVHELEQDKTKYPKQAEVISQLTERALLRLNRKHPETGEQMQMPLFYVLQLITRKRQAVCWPDGMVFHDENGVEIYRADAGGESQKVDFAEALIADLTACDLNTPGSCGERDENGKFVGERVIVFSQFKGPLEELQRRLEKKGVSTVTFNGDTPDHIREEITLDGDRRTTKNKYQVILAHYLTGGVGLNLNAFTQTIFLDEHWNPAGEEQAMARTQRMGQTEETTVHIIRMKKTIDDWLAALIDEKRDMIDGFDANMGLATAMLDALVSGEI